MISRCLLDALEEFTREMKRDHEYAWLWHCHVAKCFYDVGASARMANNGASRFMNSRFGIDTSRFPEFKEFDSI